MECEGYGRIDGWMDGGKNMDRFAYAADPLIFTIFYKN